MSFQPVLPSTGYAGWKFLTRTKDVQLEAFAKSAEVKLQTDYFRQNIAKATTPEALVKDRRLLTVALGAFGLDGDIDAKAFIQQILEQGTLKDDALANKLADKTYAQLTNTFGYADLGGLTGISGFADKIIARFEARAFEAAVGEQDGTMRMALHLEQGMADVVKQSENANARWFGVMGNTPLRRVFETALGLPSSFGAIDLDQQLTQFKDRAESAFGTADIGELASEENREKIIRLFMVRSEAAAYGGYSGSATALSLVSSLAANMKTWNQGA